MRRLRVSALVAAALLAGAAVPRTARAADSVLVQVGGSLAGRAGGYVDVPVSVDMSGAPGRTLGGYRLTLTFDPTVLSFYQVNAGNFGPPLVNSDSSGQGRIQVTSLLPAGATGNVLLFTARFYVFTDTIPSAISLQLGDLTAASNSSTPFEDLLPIARVVNGSFCGAVGTWGDVDGDGVSNSRDALLVLSSVVGIQDSLANVAMGDVDGDGKVTSRDALIILSYAVGLDVSGFRIGQVAAGACATGSATTLTILPDSLELSSGQTVPITVLATDASGRQVAATQLSWTSSNSSVAVYLDNVYDAPPAGSAPGRSPESFYGQGVQARDAGTAVLTAELSPGVKATLKVVVLQHRRSWYVDIRRAAGAPTQTGSAALPFEFIGDALDPTAAADGDTVHVATGTYPEVVSGSASVTILGDSLDRPVLDPRGAPYSSTTALYMGGAGGRAEVAHLVIDGAVVLYGVDNVVRDVRLDDVAADNAIDIYSNHNANSAESGTEGLGNVLVDGLVISHHTQRGVWIEQADSVTIRNSIIVGDSTREDCYAGYSGGGAVEIDDAGVVNVHDNQVSGAACKGIGAYTDDGRVTISHNTVSAVGTAGVVAAGRVVALDHNVIRDIGYDSAYSYYPKVGVHVTSDAIADSVTSVGDSISDVQAYNEGYNDGPYAFLTDTAQVVRIDSARVGSIATSANSSFGEAFYLRGATQTLTHSRVMNVNGDGLYLDTPSRALTSRGNHYQDLVGSAVYVYFYCDCEEGQGSDSVTSVSDTAYSTHSGAIDIEEAYWTRVDSAVVDSGGSVDGVDLYYDVRAAVVHSAFSRMYSGVYIDYVDSAAVVFNQFNADTIGLQVGAINGNADSVRVVGNGFTGNPMAGMWIADAAVLADSNITVTNGTGMYFDYGGAGLVTRARFQQNGIGVWLSGNAGGVSVEFSNFLNDTTYGAENDGEYTLDATNNYWGAADGPSCVEVCSGSGDAISGSVDFSGFATGAWPWPSAPAGSAGPVLAVRSSGARAAAAPARTARPSAHRRRPKKTAAVARPPAPERSATPTHQATFPKPWHRGQSQ